MQALQCTILVFPPACSLTILVIDHKKPKKDMKDTHNYSRLYLFGIKIIDFCKFHPLPLFQGFYLNLQNKFHSLKQAMIPEFFHQWCKNYFFIWFLTEKSKKWNLRGVDVFPTENQV
jgi:hypothetical protein